MSLLETGAEEEKENVAPQKWIIRPSRSTDDSFEGESSLSGEGRLGGSSEWECGDIKRLAHLTDTSATASSDGQHATPRKQGILRIRDTPGTGQSVRFGKRLYDDGDESRMSASTANSSGLTQSPRQDWLREGDEEEAVERSLGHVDTGRSNDTSSPQHSPPTWPTQGEMSMDTVALPSLEGYSNLEDTSFAFASRDEMAMHAQPRNVKGSADSFEDMSFNESFLRAEIELAKRQMEEDADDETRMEEDADGQTRMEEEGKQDASVAPSSDPTLIMHNGEQQAVEERHNEEDPSEGPSEGSSEEQRQRAEVTAIVNVADGQATPVGANTTQASEYMSAHSPASSAPHWVTPSSNRSSHAPSQDGEWSQSHGSSALDGAGNASSQAYQGEESPSAQRVSRRGSLNANQGVVSRNSPLARLQSLTNTPARRSPLSEVLLSQAEASDRSINASEEKVEHVVVATVMPASFDSSSSPTSSSFSRSYSFSTTHPIIEEIFRETDELDQVHSQRSEVLLKRARQAEADARHAQQLLEDQTAVTAAARREAEAVQSSLKAINEGRERVEGQRKERMQELEALVAKLNGQLDARQNCSRVAGETSEEKQGEQGSWGEHEARIGAADAVIESQQQQLNELLRKQDDYELLRVSSEEAQQRHEEDQARFDTQRRELEGRLAELEAAYHSMQVERDEREDHRKDELTALAQEVSDLQEERNALQDALSSAQKQIGNLQCESGTSPESSQSVPADVEALERRLEELQEALHTTEQASEERNQQHLAELKAITLENEALRSRNEEMEVENDSLLQSLADAQEHRRTMEEGFLAKRELALQESQDKERQALALAEEMQGRLEQLEAKLQKMAARTTMLEHEVGDRGLQLVKLERAKERLEEDNVNYSIALASKQQELSLLKRNTRSQRNTPVSAASNSQRLGALTARPFQRLSSSKGPLSETQAAAEDESGSSLPPLQSGPSQTALSRRKTMDVDTPSARPRPSSARVARAREAMPPPTSTARKAPTAVIARAERHKSPDEDTKVTGRPLSRTSSHASQQSGESAASTVRASTHLSTSSSPRKTLQTRPSLSSSITAQQGPMDISELQTGQHMRDWSRVQRVPPSKTRTSVAAVPA